MQKAHENNTQPTSSAKTVIRDKSPSEVPLKRPRSAYNMFIKSENPKIKQQFPHMGAKEIVTLAAERYNKLTPAEKQIYIDQL